jgi:branched-chain amino acid transport system permease protein
MAEQSAETFPITVPATGRRATGLWIAAAVACLVALPLLTREQFLLHVGTMVCFAAIGAASLHLVIRTGHVSLGHAAFVGVGAYACVNLFMKLQLPFIVALAGGALASGALALAIGPVILRLTGKYFVLVTFLLGEIMRMVFVDWQEVTGGANGIFDIPPPAPMFRSPVAYYYLALAAAAACIGFCARLLASEVGRTIDSIREGERLAQCAGVPVIRMKVAIFVIACTMAGLDGGLLAHYAKYISPSNFSIVESLNYVVMNVIGGMHTLLGPLLGAVFLVVLPELLRGYVELQQILFGIVLIIVMAFLPTGIVGLGAKLRALVTRNGA